MFIAQSTLEAWLDAGKAEVNDQIVHLKKLRREYAIEPAVKFLAVMPEDRGGKLIGKVLSEKRVLELGGEILGDSVLFGETAFQVQSGYVGTLKGQG